MESLLPKALRNLIAILKSGALVHIAAVQPAHIEGIAVLKLLRIGKALFAEVPHF